MNKLDDKNFIDECENIISDMNDPHKIWDKTNEEKTIDATDIHLRVLKNRVESGQEFEI